jgi:hypothetical protein
MSTKYETVDIVNCGSCGEEYIRAHTYIEATSECKDGFKSLTDLTDKIIEVEQDREFEPHVWVCPLCNRGETFPKKNFGCVFSCPDCGKKNVQIIEPRNITNKEGNTFVNYCNCSATCMHCEAEFGVIGSIGGKWYEQVLVPFTDQYRAFVEKESEFFDH